MASSARARALPLALAVLCALSPGGSAARYFLCAFRCPGCNDTWTSCRPEPCNAALEEDGCADGSEPARLQLLDALFPPPPPQPQEAQPGEEEFEGDVSSALADARRASELLPLLRRNGTEAHLTGPAHCLAVLPAAQPRAPQQAECPGLPRGAPPSSAWGTFRERCAVGAKLSLAAERILAERGAGWSGSAEELCELAMERARRGIRSMRSCHLGRADRGEHGHAGGMVRARARPRAARCARSPHRARLKPCSPAPSLVVPCPPCAQCEDLARSLWPVSCALLHAAAAVGNRTARARTEAARQSGLLLSARRRPADGEGACGATAAALLCEREPDRPVWVVASALLCAGGLFAAQGLASAALKVRTHVEAYMPEE